MTPVVSKRLRRGLWWGAGGVVALVGVVGALHLPCARSLAMAAGGCPVAHPLSLEAAEKGRELGAQQFRGDGLAPARPAFIFALDTTTYEEARGWATAHHLSCEEPREGAMKCAAVPPEALGMAPDAETTALVWLEFDANHKLVNATSMRSHLPADVASRTAEHIAQSLADKLGAPAKAIGTFDPQHLSLPSAESIALRSYKFGDYVADVSVLNIPNSGIAVREHYMSARD